MLLLTIVAKIGIPSSNRVRFLLIVLLVAGCVVWIRRGADDYYDDDRPDRDTVDRGNE
jgi:hypothetical protein